MSVDVRGMSNNRVVVHYCDGRSVRGYTVDFNPNRDCFHMRPVEDAPGKQMMVHMNEVKAVFFVKDITTAMRTGRTAALEKLKAQPSMRRIVVKFPDGEVIAGGTCGYSPARSGFFIFPLDDTTNNERVYVVRDSAEMIRALTPKEDLLEVMAEMKGTTQVTKP